MRQVYLDHASTTYIDQRVLDAMMPYLTDNFGNPSAIYEIGRKNRVAVDGAREKIAKILGVGFEEIIFTGSGTESVNMAILGVPRFYQKKHIITSRIEHHAVLRPCEHLEKEGFRVTYIKPDKYGMILPETVESALEEDTVLISIMYANNEIGTINPIKEIAKVIRDKKKEWGRGANEPPFFHTDACQAAGYLDLNVLKLGVDLLTLNGSKIYGPKGVGMLYLRRGVKLEPLVFGGGQEFKLRSGTENVPAIIGLAEALKIANDERETEGKRVSELRDTLRRGIEEKISKVVLNGHPTECLPNNLNISILDIEGEAILLYLDSYGIYVSTGSACDSSSLEPSHVILGIGKSHEYAHGSIRFSLGRKNTKEDIDYVLENLPKVVELLRSASPLNLK